MSPRQSAPRPPRRGSGRSGGRTGQAQRSQPVDWGTSRAQERPAGSERVDWGVGRGPAPAQPTPGERARSPWPTAGRRRSLTGIAFALLGLALATWSAMRLAVSADAGHPWIPPWLVVVLGGAGLVSAAGYLAWAGGTAVRGESERWEPAAVDAAAGLTRGTVRVLDADRLLTADGEQAREPWDDELPSGPAPIMGSSTVDQSTQAPAGVAGAVGGFMLAAAVVCAVLALVLGPAWLLGTAALATGGVIAIRLAGDWLGRP